MNKLADLCAYNFAVIYRIDKYNRNVGTLSRYPLESKSDSDDRIIANEVQNVSI